MVEPERLGGMCLPLRHTMFELLLVELDGDFKGSLECGPGAQRDVVRD